LHGWIILITGADGKSRIKEWEIISSLIKNWQTAEEMNKRRKT